VGLPKGLLYQKYSPFIQRFFYELGTEIISSEDTNKRILDYGVKYCVDDACIPIKVFHGHVIDIKDKCDMLVIPRIMSVREREYICPKFCGLPEMIVNSIPNMPLITKKPLYINSQKKLLDWCFDAALPITKNKSKVVKAFKAGIHEQQNHKTGINNLQFKHKIALVGHPYNIYDDFINMSVVSKLNSMGIGVCTEETLEDDFIDNMAHELYKKPFWTFARKNYGFSTYMALNKKVDGIVYLSSFACGIDSVVIELIKNKLQDFPIMVMKLDEHSGEAGFNTRLEAYSDMIKRRA
jgi:predicted nucleotide-binding protein (sugar kinase/HSP70/actin superfamily)